VTVTFGLVLEKLVFQIYDADLAGAVYVLSGFTGSSRFVCHYRFKRRVDLDTAFGLLLVAAMLPPSALPMNRQVLSPIPAL
jgi:hypothetical protein